MSDASAPDQREPSSLQPQDSSTNNGVASESVLPSLMQVYNTMIQSKTPEGGPRTGSAAMSTASYPSFGGMVAGDMYSTAAAAAAAMQNNNDHIGAAGPPSNVAEWNAYTAATGGVNSSLPSVPPIPPNAFGGVVEQKEGDNTRSKTGRASSRGRTTTAQPENRSFPTESSASLSSGGGGGGGRSLRKRSHENNNNSPPGSVSSGRGGGGGSNKARRKEKDSDGRWSKRFSWPEDLHRDFVSAIFDVGLKHSSPSTILEQMPKHEQITSERVKSHLQKYRLHRIKSKKEFMASYDSGLKKINNISSAGGVQHEVRSFNGGEAASFLTHAVLHTSEPSPSGEDGLGNEDNVHHPQQQGSQSNIVMVEDSSSSPEANSANPTNNKSSTAVSAAATKSADQELLTLPRLTEAEKQSPIGTSMGYLIGLFFSLKQQLMAQRAVAAASNAAAAAKAKAAANESNPETPAAAVYNSFVSGPGGAGGGPGAPLDAGAPLPLSTRNPEQLPAPTVVSNPSTRSNLEENNMMKREMQNQMAFQNKMRGLKQQELNKFCNTDASSPSPWLTSFTGGGNSGGVEPSTMNPDLSPHNPEDPMSADPLHQGAGETAANSGGAGVDARPSRGFSIGGVDDFWNTDVVDEQLFEFLMSEG